MTPLARRADQPGTLALNAEDDVSRSAAVVQAAGGSLILNPPVMTPGQPSGTMSALTA